MERINENKNVNESSLSKEGREALQRFMENNPGMGYSNWVAIRQNILKENGDRDPDTKRFLIFNGLVLSGKEIPDADTRKELDPRN